MKVDGARLRAMRLRQGFSQEQLAAKSGYGVRTIRRIEQGLHQPQPRTLKDLAEALGVTSDELCSEARWMTASGEKGGDVTAVDPRDADTPSKRGEDPDRGIAVASRGGFYGVPRGLSMFFTGRENEMRHVGELLTQQSAVSIHAAIEGLAGIGKTELVLQLVHRLARGDLFPGGIFWLDAEQPDLRSTWGGKIADDLGIAPGTTDNRCGEVLRRLSGERHRLLVVLDNVESWRADSLPAPVPQGPHVVVLVTTRERNLGGAQFVHFELGFLDEPHDRLLLQKIAGREVEPGGAVLLQELGGYALGLELAGAFLGTYPSESAASYLELLRQTSERPEREMTGRVRYERTVDDALRATWDRLEISERKAWLVAASFEPEPVSRPLAEAAGLDAAARRALERRHLLRAAQNGRWIMHRLIRDFGLRAGSEGERREALEQFVRGCFAAVSKAGASGPELYSRDRPHFDSALRRASEVLDPESEFELVYRHLWPLVLRKCFADDSKVFARLARIAESRGDYGALLGVFQWWFMSLILRADWKAAEDLAVSVLGLAQRQHRPKYRLVGRTISGMVAFQTGDLRGALLHFEPAIAGLEQDESVRSVGAGSLLLSQAAHAALLRGQPARAQVLSKQAARHSLARVDVAARALVSVMRAMLDQMCGNVEDVIRRAERALEIAVEHHIPVVAWQARIVLAWAKFTRDASTGLRALDAIREALGALQELSLLNVPQLLAMGVEVAAGVGEHRAAAQLGQNALRVIQRTNSSIMEAEVWRQLASVAEARDARLEYLGHAIAIAEKQGATWWSLRAMIDRVNVVEVQRRPEAIEALREVYGRISEGLDLPILSQARALLD